MELNGIKFNYSPSTDAVNALSIRQNFATAVATPEWVKGNALAQSSPAAYAITAVAAKVITIQASFAVSPDEPVTVDVRADGGGVLGACKTEVLRPGGHRDES